MKALFLGVGEACDPSSHNTSISVECRSGSNVYYILLDCGFTTPHRYFATIEDPEQLNALWISHFHGDHFFGVPLLLLRFWEMGRGRPLAILGPPGVKEKIEQALDLAYPGFWPRLQYPVEFKVLVPGTSCNQAGCRWTVAWVEHHPPALALRLEGESGALFYSGDGRPTSDSLALAHGCDLVIHESFSLEPEFPKHGSVAGSIAFAREAGAKNLALVHVDRLVRTLHGAGIQEKIDNCQGLRAFLPKPGDLFEFQV